MSIKTFDLVGNVHGREYTEWGEYVSAVDYRELERENERLRQLPTRNALIKARDQLIDERNKLKDENECLRKDAELYRQIERAAKDLPNGWEIRVCVEKGAGYAELYDPDGCEIDFPNSCETLALTVSDAIDAAISSQENPS